MISRRGLMAGLFAGVALPAFADQIDRSPLPRRRGQPERAAPRDASGLIAAAKLGGTVAYVVADAATGEVLEAREPGVEVPPASVLKSITALYALAALGPGYRYDTQVLATGPVQNGIVQGDIVLAGAGDPTLQTDQLGDLVARLAVRGVRGLTGRFLVWAGALPALPQISAEQPEHVGYNPAISGLNLNFNRVHFEWRRAGGDWALSMDARGERFVPAVAMARARIANREVPLFTYDSTARSESWTVASGALGKGGSRWLPVRLPALYTGEVFQTLAAAQGITLPAAEIASARPKGEVLARHSSEAMTDVLRDMLRFSTNLTAEAVGLRASGQSNLDASGAAMTDWARQTMGITGRFEDHSGLGSGSRITAEAMVRAMVWARRNGNALQPILRDYGMRDDKGAEIEGHPTKVRAKSGTLNFVSGLAGHILPPDGRELVFAIFAADPARRDALPKSDREDPPGGAAWTKRARRLHGQLIASWANAYG